MTEPRTRPWMPPIPGPLQRLFDCFPLTTYPANDLPARSPSPSSLPTLYVHVSEEDARSGRPSFHPTCLKWQTFLNLARIPFTLESSTNHASPSGALPFLLPPTVSASSSSSLPPSPRPVPVSELFRYTSNHSTGPSISYDVHPHDHLSEAYTTLLDRPVRVAWLTALYLDPVNTPLLQSLYINPASSSSAVRAALLRSLRSAAEAEVAKLAAPAGSSTSSGGWRLSVAPFGEVNLGGWTPAASIDPERIYADAEDAFGAMAALLGKSDTGWFFGVTYPSLLDAAVFAFTCLVFCRSAEGSEGLGDWAGLEWRDGGRLDKMVRAAGNGELVSHRRKIWDMCWGQGKEEHWRRPEAGKE